MRRSKIDFWQMVMVTFVVGAAIPAVAAPKPKPTPTPTSAVTPTTTATPAPTPTRTPTPQPGAVSISISDPTAGATINSDVYNVRGSFTGPTNTGVTVNDRIAYTSGTYFMANGIPLAAGTNTITATATGPDGQAITTSVTVTASGAPPDLLLKTDVSNGVAPLTVTFTYDYRSTQPIQKVAIDFDGDGRNDFWTRKPVTAVQNTYTTPGLYVATMTITDTAGGVHTSAIGIEVTTGNARDALFRSVWDAMNAALVRGDVNAALISLNSRAQEKYARVFNDLVADMPSIVASYSPPQFVSGQADYLEYAINRIIDGENQIFFVYLLRDADGVWRMDSM